MENYKKHHFINGFIEKNSLLKVLSTYVVIVFILNVIFSSLLNIHILGYNVEMKTIVVLPLFIQFGITFLMYRCHKNRFMKGLSIITFTMVAICISLFIYDFYKQGDFFKETLFLNVVIAQLIFQMLIGLMIIVSVVLKKIDLKYSKETEGNIIKNAMSYIIVLIPILVFIDIIFYYNIPIKYLFFFTQLVLMIGLLRKDKSNVILWSILLKIIIFSTLYLLLEYNVIYINDENTIQMVKTFLILMQLFFELFLLYVFFMYYDEEKMEKQTMKKALVLIIANVVWTLNLLSVVFLMLSYVVTCFNPLLMSVLSGVSKEKIVMPKDSSNEEDTSVYIVDNTM